MFLFEITRSLRPLQWIKNLFIFAPLIFSQNIFNLSLFFDTLIAFVIFCFLSGSLYIFNDIKDIEEDKLHPLKSKRPLASGRIRKDCAYASFIVLSVSVLATSYFLSADFFIIVLVYFGLQIAYSLFLKTLVILDVFIIASGFFIRVIAGGLAIEVDLSPWLLICTIFLSLFIALSKRRHELVLLEENAGNHRASLKKYSPYLLDQMIAVMTASIIITYCLYTISEETVAKFGTTKLLYTIPFVLYGILRYLYLVHQKSEGGSPEHLVIKDLPLLIDVFLWVVSLVIILYLL